MIMVRVKLTSGLHIGLLSTDRLEVALENHFLIDLQDELIKIANANKEKKTFQEYLFIVNGYSVKKDYLLKDGDEVVILPWLTRG